MRTDSRPQPWHRRAFRTKVLLDDARISFDVPLLLDTALYILFPVTVGHTVYGIEKSVYVQ